MRHRSCVSIFKRKDRRITNFPANRHRSSFGLFQLIYTLLDRNTAGDREKKKTQARETRFNLVLLPFATLNVANLRFPANGKIPLDP